MRVMCCIQLILLADYLSKPMIGALPAEPLPMTDTFTLPTWETDGTHRIPFGVYTDEQLHRRELDRFFYQGHWCYVGLEAEVTHAGDYKRTSIGERSVILTRSADGALLVVVQGKIVIDVVR